MTPEERAVLLQAYNARQETARAQMAAQEAAEAAQLGLPPGSHLRGGMGRREGYWEAPGKAFPQPGFMIYDPQNPLPPSQQQPSPDPSFIGPQPANVIQPIPFGKLQPRPQYPRPPGYEPGGNSGIRG